MSVLKMGSRQNPKCHISTSARLFFLHIETLRDVHQESWSKILNNFLWQQWLIRVQSSTTMALLIIIIDVNSWISQSINRRITKYIYAGGDDDPYEEPEGDYLELEWGEEVKQGWRARRRRGGGDPLLLVKHQQDPLLAHIEHHQPSGPRRRLWGFDHQLLRGFEHDLVERGGGAGGGGEILATWTWVSISLFRRYFSLVCLHLSKCSWPLKRNF